MPVTGLTGETAIILIKSVLPWSMSTAISSPTGGLARK
jgi:hypothetical protein